MSHSALSQFCKALTLSSILYAFPQAHAADTKAPSLSITRNFTNNLAWDITLNTTKSTRTFLQGSPNTTNWINLNVTSTNGGTYTFTDIPLEQDRSFFYRAVAERTQGNLAQRLVDDDPFLGSTDAPITIVEFGDYLCAFCARFSGETLPRIKKEYIDTSKVKFIYRDFPFIKDSSFTAALATESVRVQGGNTLYWKMHDFLFANRPLMDDVTAEVFTDFALQYSLPIGAHLRSKQYLPEIMLDKEDGITRVNINGTPTFIINDTRIDGAQPYEIFKQTIDALLEGKKP